MTTMAEITGAVRRLRKRELAKFSEVVRRVRRGWFWVGSHADYDKLLGRRPARQRLQPTAAC
jgi:hypothetical protein